MRDWAIQRRKERGREIAERFKSRIKRRPDGSYSVPSEKAPRRRYKVTLNPTEATCMCPDFRDHGGAKCKHIYAVEHLLRGDRDDGVAAHGTPPPGGKPPPRRPTYPRDWPLYNETQTSEEDEFEPLLHALCRSIPQPEHGRGRRPVPLADVVFACVAKVYLDKSARLVIPRLNRAHKEGYLTRPIKFGRITAFLESESATQILHDLIVRSSLPVGPIERVFAVDSTGFVGSRFVRWQDIKYRGSDERDWAKMHAMCGTETTIFTAVVIKERDAADLHQLEELLRITAQNFAIREVLADRIYNVVKNQKAIAAIGAQAYIPWKSSHTGGRGGIWKQKFIEWNADLDESLEHYHKRSLIEAAFSAMKRKFGDSLSSKKEVSMKNEALCKALCHNISCLIALMFQRRIGVEFFADIFQRAAEDRKDAAD